MKKSTIIILLIAFVCALGALADDTKSNTKSDKKVYVVSPDRSITVSDEHALQFIDESDATPRGFLGVNLSGLTAELRDYFRVPKDTGALIAGIVKDGPADKAGLKAGDVIVAIDGQKVESEREVGKIIAEHKGGDQIRIEVVRDGASQQFFATLVERERPQVFLRRIPGGDEVLEWNDQRSQEAMKRLQELIESPEWKTRVKRMGDCDELRVKIELLQKQLDELQKKIEKR